MERSSKIFVLLFVGVVMATTPSLARGASSGVIYTAKGGLCNKEFEYEEEQDKL